MKGRQTFLAGLHWVAEQRLQTSLGLRPPEVMMES